MAGKTHSWRILSGSGQRASVRLLLALALLAAGMACAQVDVMGALSRRHTLSAGSEVQGKVLVRNAGDQEQMVKVYLTGYQTTADGRTSYADPADCPRSNAAWVHLTPAEQVVPARGTASFHYIIRVPEDDRLTGTYWSMLMVHPEPMQAYQPPAPGAGKAQVGIRSVTRIGIHLITHIGQSGSRALRFLDRRFEITADRAVLKLSLENSGERHLSLEIWAELFDAQGVSIGRFPAGRHGLYPGSAICVPIDFTGIPAGPYQALVVADNGDENVFGARYDLEIPARKTPDPAAPDPAAPGSAAPGSAASEAPVGEK